MASDFEAEPNTLDQHLEKAQKAAEDLVSGLKRARRSVRGGSVSDIGKGLGALEPRLADVRSTADGLSGA